MNKYHLQTEFIRQNHASTVVGDKARKAAAAKRKPRVLMVGMHLTKTRGGISTLIAEILKSSVADEFDFDYIESQAEDFGRFGKAFLAVRAIGRFVASGVWKRPEIVYVHLGSNASLYRESIFILLAKILRKKVVAHFHAGDVDNYYPFQIRIGQKFISRALSLSDVIIAVSEESARQLRNVADAPHISVITNAVNTDDFAGDELFAGERTDDGAVRLLFVGAIGKLKGERDLIRALAILPGKHPNLKVSFLGYGAESLKDFCEESGVADYVEFLGAVSLSERIGFFQKADIFVLPTYAEAMPMSVIEAMAAGLPVISTSVGGIPELVENGADGFLFAPGDVHALAEKISFLVNDKNLRIEFGKRARQKARAEMDFRQYVGKLRLLLSAVCDSEENQKNKKI